MEDKTFVVSHAKAREPITVKGKTLKKALEAESLNPAIWKQIPGPEATPKVEDGEAEETPGT